MAKKDKKALGESEVKQKFKQNPLLYIGSVLILVLVIIAFVGADLIRPRTREWDFSFGSYDKALIKWAPDNQFDQYRQNAVQYYQYQGYDMSNQWIYYQIWQQAFDWTVVHTAILQLMARSNYHIPVKRVDREVAKHPDFLENGRFSAALYNSTPESRRLAIWRQTQEEMIKGVFINDFFDGLMMTTAEAEFIGSFASPKRSFDMVSFNIDDYPESEYLAYAGANSRLFDSIHLSKITINSGEREANKILDSINSGVISFEDSARAQSQDYFADRGGDMGARYIYELTNEIPSIDNALDNILNLRRGEISPVIQIGESYVIYRVEEELKKADLQDETVMERVRLYVRNNERGRMDDFAASRAEEFIRNANETDFETAAAQWELEVRSMGPFPINYGGIELFAGLQSNPIADYTENEISELSRNENFWEIAFSTKLNTLSRPFVRAEGNFSKDVLVLLPTEEIDVMDTEAQDAASLYLSEWLNRITDQSVHFYFKANPRMNDQFMDTFFREMM